MRRHGCVSCTIGGGGGSSNDFTHSPRVRLNHGAVDHPEPRGVGVNREKRAG